MPTKERYWQIGSGRGERDYSRESLDYGIAFVGEQYREDVEGIRVGGRIILRRGTAKIVAVGRATEHEGRVSGFADEEDTRWLRDFDGWDLPAYCYVEWHKPATPEDARAQLSQRAISRVNKAELREQAEEVLEKSPHRESNREGPRTTRRITDEEIESFLEDRFSTQSVRGAITAIHTVRRLADKYYSFGYKHWDEVKEHDIRTFLIMPLLLALGWREEQIMIELNPGRLGERNRKSIDVACFSEEYQPGCDEVNRKNCRLVIESKRFSSGIADAALKQAEGYAKPLPNCNLIVVTNGYCYRKTFERSYSTNAFSQLPSAYLNIREPRDEYPLDPDHVNGALEVFRLLLPQTRR
jgi:hypothetical protein